VGRLFTYPNGIVPPEQVEKQIPEEGRGNVLNFLKTWNSAKRKAMNRTKFRVVVEYVVISLYNNYNNLPMYSAVIPT